MEILNAIPSVVILGGIIAVASTQAVILWRLQVLEKMLNNGISKDLRTLDKRMDTLEKECIRHHGIVIP